jgi:hypothetical protein
LRSRTNPTRRFEVTKSKEVRVKATLGEEPVIELALV